MNHYPELATEKECTACFACVDICLQKAITTYINDEGHYAVTVDKEKCIKCGRCEKICINSRINYGNNDLHKSTVYAGYTTDDQLRRAATSGGAFAAFAKKIIADGGLVVGACFDGTSAKHIIVDRIEDIGKLQGSKYTPSTLEGIYIAIQKELENRKVLFSGTGCQVAAVISYFSNNRYKDNLYTVDLVCGGVPSIELIRKFNAHYDNQYSICSFRNKDKYELTVKNQDNKERVFRSRSLPLGGFSCELTNRLSCYNCQFAYCHRNSDLTIGDLWNYKILPQEHSKGLSMIICNTSKGKELLMQAEIKATNVDWEDVLRTNYRIAYGKGRIYSLRKKLQQNLKYLPYDDLEKVYCLSMKPYDIKLFGFKVYRHFLYKYDQMRKGKYIDKLLNENKYDQNN